MTEQLDDGAGTGRILTTLLLVTLILSLFLNAYMLFRPPPRIKLSCPTVQAGQVQVFSGPAEMDCAQKLRSCRQAEVSEIVKVIRAGVAAPAGAAADRGRRLRVEARVGTELQQGVLCDITRRHERERWFNKRHKIAKSLVPNLEDQQKQRQDLEKEVKEFSRVLGWSEAQRERFQLQYGPARQKRLASVVGALTQEPVAFDAVLAQVRGLYADEDRLVLKLFGDRARRQLRAARLENRTLIMALAAAMAKVPWDHSMTW